MIPDAAVPQLFTTVLCADQTVVHVAGLDSPAPAGSSREEQLTLCRRPVVCEVASHGFHRNGCADCALEAVRIGILSIADRRQATVNLPRFLAARRLRSNGAADGSMPDQRDARAT